MSLVVLLIVAALIGTWLSRPLALRAAGERVLFGMLTGLGVWAAAAVAAGSISIPALRFLTYLFAVAALGLEIFVLSPRRRRSAAAPAPVSVSREPLEPLERVAAISIAAGLACGLVNALAPATSWDAAVAHLALPADYARMGRIAVFEGNDYSAYPHLLHVLFTLTFAGGGERATMLFAWCVTALAVLAVYVLGRRVDSRRCGLIAAAMFAVAPVFIDQAGMPGLDLAFAGWTAAALAAFLAWRQEKFSGFLLLAGFLAGASCGIRHTGYLVCLFLFAGTLATGRGERVRAGAAFAALALAGALPWVARGALTVGNPVYPLFASFFDASIRSSPDAFLTHESLRGTGLTDYIMFPWRIIMQPHLFDGWEKSPGGLILIFGPLGLLAAWRRAWPLALYAAAGITCLFFFRQLARYMLPFFIPGMVVAALALCRLERLRWLTGTVLVLGLVYHLALGAAAVHFRVPPALGLVSREDYLRARVDRYEAFEWVNANLARDSALLTLDPRTYYIDRQTFSNVSEMMRLRNMQLDEQLRWMRARGIGHLLLPVTYLRESPGFSETGLNRVFWHWRAEPRRFLQVAGLDLHTRGQDERVEVHKVLYPWYWEYMAEAGQVPWE